MKNMSYFVCAAVSVVAVFNICFHLSVKGASVSATTSAILMADENHSHSVDKLFVTPDVLISDRNGNIYVVPGMSALLLSIKSTAVPVVLLRHGGTRRPLVLMEKLMHVSSVQLIDTGALLATATPDVLPRLGSQEHVCEAGSATAAESANPEDKKAPVLSMDVGICKKLGRLLYTSALTYQNALTKKNFSQLNSSSTDGGTMFLGGIARDYQILVACQLDIERCPYNYLMFLDEFKSPTDDHAAASSDTAPQSGFLKRFVKRPKHGKLEDIPDTRVTAPPFSWEDKERELYKTLPYAPQNVPSLVLHLDVYFRKPVILPSQRKMQVWQATKGEPLIRQIPENIRWELVTLLGLWYRDELRKRSRSDVDSNHQVYIVLNQVNFNSRSVTGSGASIEVTIAYRAINPTVMSRQMLNLRVVSNAVEGGIFIKDLNIFDERVTLDKFHKAVYREMRSEFPGTWPNTSSEWLSIDHIIRSSRWCQAFTSNPDCENNPSQKQHLEIIQNLLRPISIVERTTEHIEMDVLEAELSEFDTFPMDRAMIRLSEAISEPKTAEVEFAISVYQWFLRVIEQSHNWSETPTAFVHPIYGYFFIHPGVVKHMIHAVNYSKRNVPEISEEDTAKAKLINATLSDQPIGKYPNLRNTQGVFIHL